MRLATASLALALLATPLAQPVQAQETTATTLCTSPLMGACFYMQSFVFEETPSVLAGRSDYWMSLVGYWSGSAFDGLTDLYWLARFDAFETSILGGSVWLMAMTPDELTSSGHEMLGQPQGLGAPSFSTLTMRVSQHFPNGTPITSCVRNCYQIGAEPEPEPPPTEPTVSVPEPGTWLLLMTGGAGLALAHRRRSRTRLA